MNPFVGPRPFSFEERERFFARDREARELFSLLTARKTVLLYSVSGAGKSSLLNAGLFPLLQAARVGCVPISRAEMRGATERIERISDPNSSSMTVVVLDQFEDFFSLFKLRAEREQFLEALAERVEDQPNVRLLISMREEWMAALEDLEELLPGESHGRLRLERLEIEGARIALERPLLREGIRFDEGVLEPLLEELLDDYGFCEPVQLQVVGYQLAEKLTDGSNLVTKKLRESMGSVAGALREYYENCLRTASAKGKVTVDRLRYWFDEKLIIEGTSRGLARRGPTHTDGIPNEAIEELLSLHIIRPQIRGDETLYELGHDRLIQVVSKANESWRRRQQAVKYMKYFAAAIVALIAVSLVTYREIRSANKLRLVQEEQLAPKLVFQSEDLLRRGGDFRTAALLHLSAARLNPREPALGPSLYRLLTRPVQNIVLAKAGSLAVWAPNGKLLATSGGNSEVLIWDLTRSEPEITRRIPCESKSCGLLAWAPGGSHLAIADPATSGNIKVWKFGEKGPELGNSVLLGTQLLALAWSNGQGGLAAGTVSGKVLLARDPLANLAFETIYEVRPLYSYSTKQVKCLAWSDRGELAFGADDRVLRVYRLDTGAIAEVGRYNSPVLGVAWSHRGQLASAGWDNTVRLFEADTYSEIQASNRELGRESEPAPVKLRQHDKRVYSVAWSHDGEYVASGGADNRIRWWHAGGAPVPSFTLDTPGETPAPLTWSAADWSVAYPGRDGSIRLLRVDPTHFLEGTLPEEFVVNTLAYSHSGNTLLTAGESSGASTWRLNIARSSSDVRQARMTLSQQESNLTATSWKPTEPVAFAVGGIGFRGDASRPDGQRQSGYLRVYFSDGATRSKFRILRLSSAVSAIGFSEVSGSIGVGTASGRFFTGIVAPGTNALMDTEAFSKPIVHVRWRNDLEVAHLYSADGSLRKWDADGRRMGDPVKLISKECPGQVMAATSRNGALLVLVCGNELYLYSNLEGTGDVKRINLPAQVTAVAVSDGGEWIATGTPEGRVMLWEGWNARSDQLISIPAHESRVVAVAFSPDGTQVASSGKDLKVAYWRVPNRQRINLCKTLGKNLTLDEWQNFTGGELTYRKACDELPLPAR